MGLWKSSLLIMVSALAALLLAAGASSPLLIGSSPTTALPATEIPGVRQTAAPGATPGTAAPGQDLAAEQGTAYRRVEAWRVSTPEQQGMDSARLLEMLDYIQAHHYPIHGIAIVRNGTLVLEAYFHPMRAEDRHYIASCTKSFVSALVGVALAQGYIDSVDQKLLDFFPDQTVANSDAWKQAIRLENLLTMSSGLAWPGRNLNESIQAQWRQSQDMVQFVLDRPMADEPGTRFRYNSGGSHLLAAIVRQTTGRPPLAFAREHLFKPLGITNVYWEADPAGLNFGGWGLELTVPDLARFGYLFLQQGVWDGQAVLPAAWVEASTTSHIETGYLDYHYGYQWWVDPAGSYHARGYGGQYIFVVPDQNLVVVFVSGFGDYEMETVPNALLQTFILPAIKSTTPLPDNPAQTASLQTRLHSLARPDPKPVPLLPRIAGLISGKTYTLAANSTGMEAFTLRFSQPPDSQAWLNITYDTGQVEWNIGLDDVYRYTSTDDAAGHRPGTMAMKGAWINDKTFKVAYLDAGYTGNFWFVFEGQAVRIHFQFPQGIETITGAVQEE